MEQRYITTLLRWSWILVIAVIVAAGTAYWTAKDQTTVYTAQSRLLVGPGIDSPHPDLNTLRAGGQLMQTYAELPTTAPFLQSIIDQLGLDMTPEDLLVIIRMRASEVTQVLRVEVTHGNPDLAIAVANAIAENLVRVSPSNPESASTQLKDQIRSQVALTEQSISDAEGRIQQIEAEIAAFQQPDNRLPGGIDMIGSITIAEARMKQFEVRLQSVSNLQEKRLEATKILEELRLDTTQRIQDLEIDLRSTADVSTQKLIIAQLARERTHLSNLQRTLLETQRPIGDKTLEELLNASEAKVVELEETLNNTNYLESRRLLISQLETERDNLSELRGIEIEREGKILEQIAQERNRLSEMQQLDVERQNVFLTQLGEERKSMDELRRTLSLLYASLQEATTNQVQIIETARDAAPVASWLWLKVLVSGAAGLIVSVLLIVGLEYLSDTIETQNDLAKLTGGPVLGVISRHKRIMNSGFTDLVVKSAPNSPASEDYRILSTKLLLSHKSNPIRSLLIASAEAKEDATEVAANLAVVLSQAGKKVTFIDAHMHDSPISRFFECERVPGLAEILSDPSGDLDTCTKASYPNLSLIPAGAPSNEAFRLLTSSRMKELITQLSEQGETVIIAAPSILASADTLYLSAQVDGVILVAYQSQTQQKNLQRVADSLKTVGVPLIGSILTGNTSPSFRGWSKFSRRIPANMFSGKLEEQTASTNRPPEA